MPHGNLDRPSMTDESGNSEWSAALKDLELRSRIRWNESLKRFNTWRIGGPSRCLIDVETEEDLAKLLPFIKKNGIQWFLIGKGSNLLIHDRIWEGVALHLAGDFKSWKPQKGSAGVSAGAALADVTFSQRCVSHGWSGMEFLIGIPGTIGGAVATNAGAHGGETSEFLKSIRWMDLEGILHQDSCDAFEFAYRFSKLDAKQGRIVVSAYFELHEKDPQQVKHALLECQRFRMEKQPYNQPSCGSVFKNPPNDYAARLIELSKLKGKIRGRAQISPKHANFIVNLGDASSDDILWLMDQAQEQVFRDHNIELIPEVQILQ
ncbi:MAG: UDP-N-acetylenolpyruvoylglucosamine reductase [Deltaproteobacteria bacterium]|nr:UDP-N-acetylenolpyruvoylglucosamine reductase [Deltaproteobacteria bacterium]